MLVMNDKFPSIDETRVKDAERKLGYMLPKEYRQFLLDYNGGRPKEGVFDIINDGDDEVNFFYGIDTCDSYDLLETRLVYMGRIPESLLPIAEDPGGNQICISIAQDTYGKIYFWDHEMEFEPEKAISPIADSFEAFINNLRAD